MIAFSPAKAALKSERGAPAAARLFAVEVLRVPGLVFFFLLVATDFVLADFFFMASAPVAIREAAVSL